MKHLLAFLIFGLCILGMAIGLIIAKKVLKKGCSTDPDSCKCKKEGKDPTSCEE